VGAKFLREISVCENYLANDEPLTLEPFSISETALDLPAAF
jgi:hypothetical protein